MNPTKQYKYNVYYSQYPVIAVKYLPDDRIIAVSSRFIQYFSKKETEIFEIQLPPAFSLTQATVHDGFISALAESPTHGLVVILNLRGVALCDSEARTLPIHYSAQDNDIFLSQQNKLYQYKISYPSSELLYQATSPITAVATGQFLNEQCIFVGIKKKILIIQNGKRIGEMVFPGVPQKLIFNASLNQLVSIGVDKIVSFYSLRMNQVVLEANSTIKIQPNQSCKYNITTMIPTEKGYLISDTNGRILSIDIKQYQMKDGRRNKDFAAFCDRLPFNVYINGYEGSFSGNVRSMATNGSDITACTEYVVLDTSLQNLDLSDENITISLGFSSESYAFYENIRKTFQLKSPEELLISAEQVDEDADIRLQLEMLELQFKSLIMDVYHIFKKMLSVDKNCPKSFYFMQGVNSAETDKQTYLKLFFKKITEEPLVDIDNYSFCPFIKENYKTILFLFRSLQKRFRGGIDALRNLYNFLGPRLKDLKSQSQEFRRFQTFKECQEFANKSLVECQDYLRKQFDFDKDFIGQYEEDSYCIQQLRYFKRKLQSLERASVEVAEARIKMRFSQTLEALFNSFINIIPEYCVTKGKGSIQLMLTEKKSQYDSILGNYELVDAMVAHDIDEPEKFLVVPGSTNRKLSFVNQCSSIREYNFQLFRSESRELSTLQQELKLDQNYRNFMSQIYVHNLYECIEMHTQQQFLAIRTFTPLNNFDQLKQVILQVNKESRGRFQFLEPYQLLSSPNNDNYFQYILHRPRNTIRLSDLFTFFQQKYCAPYIYIVPDKKFVSPKCESFFKINNFTEREIAIILKNLLDMVIFIQKQEKLTIALSPKKPKVHGFLTPQNIFLNIDSLEVHAPYFFEQRTFSNRTVVNTSVYDDICFDAPECVLTATTEQTDTYSIAMIVLAMTYAFLYLPRAYKASRDNIRPMSSMLSNLGTFYTLTDELNEQNQAILSQQKTKLSPFTSQKFVEDQRHLRLIIAILRAQVSLCQDMRAQPTQEAANQITQCFLYSTDVQCAQFFLQNAIYAPVVDLNRQQTNISRIFETNKQTSAQLYSLLSKEMQRIIKSMLLFQPSGRKSPEEIRANPLFQAVQDAQKNKIIKWQNAINMMKAAKLQKEKKEQESQKVWDKPVSYQFEQRKEKYEKQIIDRLKIMNNEYCQKIKAQLRQDVTSFPQLEIEDFTYENLELKSVKHEESNIQRKADEALESSEPETFFDESQLNFVQFQEAAQQANFEASGVPSEDSEDSVCSIKGGKTNEEKLQEYHLYQQKEQEKEGAMLQKEAEQLKQELNEHSDVGKEEEVKNDPIYAFEAEEQQQENENVYFDEHGNAIYYDPTLVEQQPQVQVDPYYEQANAPEQQMQQPQQEEQQQNLRGAYDENGVYQYYDEAGNIVPQQEQNYQNQYDYGYQQSEQYNQGGQEGQAGQNNTFDPFQM